MHEGQGQGQGPTHVNDEAQPPHLTPRKEIRSNFYIKDFKYTHTQKIKRDELPPTLRAVR